MCFIYRPHQNSYKYHVWPQPRDGSSECIGWDQYSAFVASIPARLWQVATTHCEKCCADQFCFSCSILSCPTLLPDEPPRGELGLGYLLAQKHSISSQFLGVSAKNSKPSGSYPFSPRLISLDSLWCRSNWNVPFRNPLCWFPLMGLWTGCPISQENVSCIPISSFAIQMFYDPFILTRLSSRIYHTAFEAM